MKVVFVHTDFRIYWPARLNAAKAFLRQKGVGLEIIEISGKGSPYNFAGSKNVELPYWHILFPDSEMESITPHKANREVRKKLDEISPDVVFAGAIAFPSGVASVRWAVENKKRIIIFDNARLSDTPRSAFVNFIKRRIYSCVDAIFCPSPLWDETYSFFGFKTEQIYYGVNAIDNHFWNDKPPPSKRNLPNNYFINVSRQVPKKNLTGLLKSYHDYTIQVSDPKDLILVGDGPERLALEVFVKENSLDKVHFLAFQSQEKLREYYSHSLCYILPSLYGETWGLTVNEAMATGLPVLVSNQAGCASILVKNGINGYTFSPSDPEELTELLLKFHDLPENTIKQMAANSQEIIRDWDLDRFCSGVFDALNFVLTTSTRKKSILTRLMLMVWKGRYRPT